MKPLILFALTFIACGALSVKAQQHPAITGRVTDSLTAAPLAGATIRIIGENSTATSRADGRFTIHSTSSEPLLECSHVGYLSQRIIATSTSGAMLSFLLVPAQEVLQEVEISTGYETIPAERATGSFEHIDTKLFNRSIGPDVLSRLENVTSSTLFDHRLYDIDRPSQPSLTIRGLSTLWAETAPLIILDNFPYDGDPALINPNDVASVTLLKDAAAASIWGAKAGNGVIVITTKKGNFETPHTVSFQSSLTTADKPYLFKDQSFFPSATFVDLERELFAQGFYDWDLEDPQHPPITPVVDLLARLKNGEISSSEVDQALAAFKQLDVRNDFLRYTYRHPFNQQYSLSLSGGNRFHAYNVSVGYDRDASHAVNSGMSRFTAKASHRFKFGPKWDANVDLLYTTQQQATQQIGYQTLRVNNKRIYPYAALADATGHALPIAKDYSQQYVDTAGAGMLLDWNFYPLDELDYPYTSHGQDMRTTFGINYKPHPSVNISGQYMLQRGSENQREHQPESSYYARNLVNRFTQIHNGNVETIIPYGGILALSQTARLSQAFRGQANYNNQWGNHQLTGLLGVEVREARFSYRRDLPIYGYYDFNLVHALGIDYRNTYPIYDGLSGDSRIPGDDGFSATVNRFVSEYGNIAYTFRSRYVLSASARRDASNIFGVKRNQRWSPFWSLGAAWTVSDESFYHLTALPTLKLRLTYGYSGNTAPAVSAASLITYASGTPANGLPYATVSSAPNPNLGWEQIRTLNAAIDFSTKNNRINGAIDVYRKDTKDLIAEAGIDPTLGIYSMNMNSASTRGKGFDIRLNTLNTTGQIRWNTHLLASYNKTIVTQYDLDPLPSSSAVANQLGINPIEGQVVNPVYSYRWAGLDPDTGDPQGYLDGAVTKDYYAIYGNTPLDSLVFSGSAMPQYFGSLRQEFSWKKVSLSFNITYQFDYYFKRRALSYNALFSQGEGHPEFNKRWQQPGDEHHTQVPSMIYPANSIRDYLYQYAEPNTLRGDHIRLQDIRLAYQLTPATSGRIPFKSMEVAAFVSNIGLLWVANDEKLDPQYRGSIPPSRTYALSLSVHF